LHNIKKKLGNALPNAHNYEKRTVQIKLLITSVLDTEQFGNV